MVHLQKPSSHRLALAAAITLVPVPSASAQATLFTWPLEAFGKPVATGVGDVDDDGVADFCVGESAYVYLETQARSRLAVRSGLDGAAILELDPPTAPDHELRTAIGLGDVDADGTPDVAWCGRLFPAAGPWFVRAVSGRDGHTLWELVGAPEADGFGLGLVLVGDVDGDGARDLALGTPSSTFGVQGVIQMLSGASGAELWRVDDLPGSSTALGDVLARAGDFDLDGVPDLLAGDTASTPGRVSVLSGVDGTVCMEFLRSTYTFASCAAALGDLDGDGVPEVAIGSPGEGSLTYPPIPPTGRMRVFSGATAEVLLELAPPVWTTWAFGLAVASFGDLDGDGLRDLAVAGGNIQSGCCHFNPAPLGVHSSATGDLLATVPGTLAPTIEVVPDANGDGIPDVIHAAQGYALVDGQAHETSRVVLVDVAAVGQPVAGCAGGVSSEGCFPQLGVTGAPSPTRGDPLELHVTLLPAGTTAGFLWSGAPTLLPSLGDRLCLATPVRRSPALQVSTDGDACPFGTGGPWGSIRHVLSDQRLLELGLEPGQSFHVQAWYRDPGLPPSESLRFTTSVAVEVWP